MWYIDRQMVALNSLPVFNSFPTSEDHVPHFIIYQKATRGLTVIVKVYSLPLSSQSGANHLFQYFRCSTIVPFTSKRWLCNACGLEKKGVMIFFALSFEGGGSQNMTLPHVFSPLHRKSTGAGPWFNLRSSVERRWSGSSSSMA